MNLSLQEKMMYEAMNAIYQSGIPICFKGSLVLKLFLTNMGYEQQIRHTVDIDGNWISENPPSMQQIENSLQKALDQSNIKLYVKATRVYGERQSAGFEFLDKNTDEIIFEMDLDVNRPLIAVQFYSVDNIQFTGASPTQVVADKLTTISTNKIFRRIKDVIDLYYLSQVFKIDVSEIMKVIQDTGKKIDSFDGLLNRKDELKHAYEKFRFSGNIQKLPFEVIYQAVIEYIKPFLPK